MATGAPRPLRKPELGSRPHPSPLQTALHLRALQNFRDLRGVARRTGEEWLVTVQDTEAHVPDVYEEVLGVVPITTLGPRNYCVILDPVGQDGKNQLGQKLVVKVGAPAPRPPRRARPSAAGAAGPLPVSRTRSISGKARWSWLPLCRGARGSSSETHTH